MKRNLNLYLDDILNAIRLIETYTKNSSLNNFKKDIKLQDAVIRRLEIIGEAMKKFPENIKKKYPNVRWDDFITTRNFFSHIYFGINIERVWSMIKNYIPNLKEDIQKIKEELKEV